MFRERLLTYTLVTVVAVLIWYWAAVQTRDQTSPSFRLRLMPARLSNQVVTPREITARLEMEGSLRALQQARQLAAQGELALTLGNELPNEPDTHRIDLVQALEEHDLLMDTGVRIIAADPASVDIVIDALVPVTANIRAVLPGVEPVGEEILPAQAVVRLPSRLRDRLGDELTLEAHVPQARLERLQPGVQHMFENVPLRLPSRLAGERSVTIQPPVVTIKFGVVSHIKETMLPTVRVQIAGPPEDNDEYVVEIEDGTLADVTVKGDENLIREIERNDSTVVALVHLSTREKEQGIHSKRITCFMALRPDGGAQIVQAEVGGSNQPPVVRLKVRGRKKQPG